jgi:hypothetical protein
MMNHNENITIKINEKLESTEKVESTKKLETKVVEEKNGKANSRHIIDQNTKNNVEKQQVDNKCAKCNKKLKLTDIECKCGYKFCNLHRYSDQHDCKFDYKHANKELLEKNNPLIISTKVDKL